MEVFVAMISGWWRKYVDDVVRLFVALQWVDKNPLAVIKISRRHHDLIQLGQHLCRTDSTRRGGE